VPINIPMIATTTMISMSVMPRAVDRTTRLPHFFIEHSSFNRN
jgi:hypothetical protein